MKPRIKRIKKLAKPTFTSGSDIDSEEEDYELAEESKTHKKAEVSDTPKETSAKSKSSTSSIPLAFRYDTRDTVPRPEASTGETVEEVAEMSDSTEEEVDAETPKKTAVLLPYTPLKAVFDLKTAQDLQARFASDIASNTPVKAVVEWTSTGSPSVVISKSDKLLTRSSDNQVLYHFSNAPKVKPEESKVDPKFEKSDIAKKIQPPTSSQKKVTVIVTSEVLKEVAAEIKENKGRRCKTQNKVMGGSATEYSRTAGISTKQKSEWGHLVAHRFLSDLSQTHKNLAAITNHANTEMIPVEDFIDAIVKNKLGIVKLIVTVNLFENTQIANAIKYKVCVGPHVFHFSFDPQQANKPDKANKQAMDALFAVLMENNKFELTKDKTPKESLNLSEPGMSSLFFSRSEHLKETEKAKEVVKEEVKEAVKVEVTKEATVDKTPAICPTKKSTFS